MAAIPEEEIDSWAEAIERLHDYVTRRPAEQCLKPVGCYAA